MGERLLAREKTGVTALDGSDFWNRLGRSGDCWLWEGATDPKGFGVLKAKGRVWKAHRYAWTLAHGHEPEPGVAVTHRCGNRACCRPEHLRQAEARRSLTASYRPRPALRLPRMTTGSPREERPAALPHPRVAEIVAAELRARIIEGDLADGDLLPKEDDLLTEFGISRGSFREAMRILETEGLITVRRGNLGGAVVHAPDPRSAGHMLGLMMQAQQVTLAEVLSTVMILEPACARLAAEREDRHVSLVPLLSSLNDEAEAIIDDPSAFARTQSRWHLSLVEHCGNRAMSLTLGTLETVWTHHVSARADAFVVGCGTLDLVASRATVSAHRRITAAIAQGNGAAAEKAAYRHLEASRTQMLSGDPLMRVRMTD